MVSGPKDLFNLMSLSIGICLSAIHTIEKTSQANYIPGQILDHRIEIPSKKNVTTIFFCTSERSM